MNNDTYLAHHGILGMKWGVRRYRNKDGSLTEEGKRRYSLNERSKPGDVKRALKVFGRKNFDAVGKNYEDSLFNDPELKRIRREIAPVRKKLLDVYDWDTSDDGGGGTMSKKFYELAAQYEKLRDAGLHREIQITDQYISKFNDARLKDLNYTGDIEIGRKILDRYGGVKRTGYDNITLNTFGDIKNKYGYNTKRYESIWEDDDSLYNV